jgi:hypothetical protein
MSIFGITFDRYKLKICGFHHSTDEMNLHQKLYFRIFSQTFPGSSVGFSTNRLYFLSKRTKKQSVCRKLEWRSWKSRSKKIWNIMFDADSSRLSNGENCRSTSCTYQKLFQEYSTFSYLKCIIDVDVYCSKKKYYFFLWYIFYILNCSWYAS